MRATCVSEDRGGFSIVDERNLSAFFFGQLDSAKRTNS